MWKLIAFGALLTTFPHSVMLQPQVKCMQIIFCLTNKNQKIEEYFCFHTPFTLLNWNKIQQSSELWKPDEALLNWLCQNGLWHNWKPTKTWPGIKNDSPSKDSIN